MEEMKKKELVLAVATMSNEEFEALRRGQERRVNSLEQRAERRCTGCWIGDYKQFYGRSNSGSDNAVAIAILEIIIG